MKNITKNSYPDIILHNCLVTKMENNNGDLNIEFKDGFWIVGKSQYSGLEETVATDLSKISFVDCDFEDIKISLFLEYGLFHKTFIIRRKFISLEKLILKINSGEWKLEIIDEYYGYRSTLFNCAVHSRKKPYYLDCQIEIGYYNDLIYKWNSLRKDMIF